MSTTTNTTIECRKCEQTPVAGQHKGDDVQECPDCNHILFRSIEGGEQ